MGDWQLVYRMSGFSCLPQTADSRVKPNLFITLPIELGTVIPNRIQPFHEVSICLGETASPEVDRFASWSFALSFPQRWLSGASGPEWRILAPHLPPVTRFKDYAEEQGREASRRDPGGMEGMSETKWIMNLKIANYLVSYSSEPWHNDQPQSRFFSLNGFTFKQAN